VSVRASSWFTALRLVPVMLAIAVTAVLAAEQLPEKPARFFNDYTRIVDRDVADHLNEQLAKYERESSNQLLVVFYSRMLTDSSLEDYCTRAFEKWGVGHADRDNGAVLFVFTEQHKIRIQTGYGLEASLTDAECLRIIEGMQPFFRARDYDGGASFAVSAMIEATTGEYHGTGKTLAELQNDPQLWMMILLLIAIVFVIGLHFYYQILSGHLYDANGRRRVRGGQPWYNWSWSSSGSWSSGGGGGGGSGGSGGGGGGSSFSGGGGSTGGGGASGGW
jgi:uncharacterized protein